jgi:hypothetical protein
MSRTQLGVLIGLLTFVSSFVDLRVRAHPERAYAEYIPSVIANTEPAPGRYRVLAPWISTEAATLTGLSRENAWYLTRALWFAFAWIAFQLYLETWFPRATAFGGVAGAAALLPLTYTNSWPHPDHIPELALFTLGSLAIVRHWEAGFVLILTLAAFNRETSAFLVLFYALSRPATRTHLARVAGCGTLWASVYGGLRAWRGFQNYDYLQFGRNVEFLKLLPPPYDPYYRAYAWFVVILVGSLTAASWRALRSSATPREVRAAAAVVPPFLAVAVVFSSIIETRIFTPVLPLMLPSLMFSLERPKDGSR